MSSGRWGEVSLGETFLTSPGFVISTPQLALGGALPTYPTFAISTSWLATTTLRMMALLGPFSTAFPF